MNFYSFKKGMTPKQKTAITQKGTSPVLIDGIIGYATQLQQANLSQESLKSSTQEVSQEGHAVFNFLTLSQRFLTLSQAFQTASQPFLTLSQAFHTVS